jgi:hypothetical protein
MGSSPAVTYLSRYAFICHAPFYYKQINVHMNYTEYLKLKLQYEEPL